jgi:hypothetical protein
LLFIIISSHGEEEEFVLTDTAVTSSDSSDFVKINLKEIWEAVNSNEFLKQTLKIYLIQARFKLEHNVANFAFQYI